jgi:hypothetical protein
MNDDRSRPVTSAEGAAMRNAVLLTIAVVVLVAAAGGWYWWQGRSPAGVATVPEVTSPRVADATPPAPPPAASEPPRIRHPIEAASAPQLPATLDPQALLIELFGRKAVLSAFQLDDFPRRFVATVDNLATTRAPSRLWPVTPMSGRFSVDQRAGAQVIGVDNAQRYASFIALVDNVDPRRAAQVYRQLYPQFQQAYVELGYPNRYFNDRLVEVIDLLLATPDVELPPQVHLPAINGPVRPERPWVLYEFDDPSLASLAAGQKMMLRLGPANQRRLKARLAEFRRLVATGAAAR